jgi:hypothetical protein
MRKLVLPFTLLTVAAFSLPSAPAQAQAPRTFVSAAGSDSNPCSFAAPCRHFQAAVNATSAGGEVDALDPAGYGPIVISQAVTIEGQGWSYIAPPANGNGITINAVSGKVTIRGVSLNGVGITGFTNGIVFNSGDSLIVRDSVIRNFGNIGINFVPNSSTLNQLYVSDMLVSNSGLAGIVIFPSGTGTTLGALDHVKLVNNSLTGLIANTNSQIVNVTVSDSVSENNGNDGIFTSSSGMPVAVMVRNSTIANNGAIGLEAFGNGATLRVTRSTISGNSQGWSAGAGGAVLSYADNNIDSNATPVPAPPAIGYQ